MSSSPFGCNQKNSFGSKLSKAKDNSAPEPVTLIADKNQVITAIIPFNTPMAASIRQHMHTTVLNDGQKIFIYRSVNGWTNIALDSSEAAPKLTCDPVTTLIKAWTEFNKCPQVSNITIKWKGSEQALSYDDIAGMEAEFVALPEGTGDADNQGASYEQVGCRGARRYGLCPRRSDGQPDEHAGDQHRRMPHEAHVPHQPDGDDAR